MISSVLSVGLSGVLIDNPLCFHQFQEKINGLPHPGLVSLLLLIVGSPVGLMRRKRGLSTQLCGVPLTTMSRMQLQRVKASQFHHQAMSANKYKNIYINTECSFWVGGKLRQGFVVCEGFDTCTTDVCKSPISKVTVDYLWYSVLIL